MKANSGNDTVLAGRGSDAVFAGRGADYVAAGPGRDTINAGGGADYVVGGAGRDAVRGGRGVDQCAGNGRVDTRSSCGPEVTYAAGEADGGVVEALIGHAFLSSRFGLLSYIPMAGRSWCSTEPLSRLSALVVRSTQPAYVCVFLTIHSGSGQAHLISTRIGQPKISPQK